MKRHSLQPIVHKGIQPQPFRPLSHWDELQDVTHLACELPQAFSTNRQTDDNLETFLIPQPDDLLPQSSGISAHSHHRVSSRIFLL